MLELLGLGKAYNGKSVVSDFTLKIVDDEYVTLLGPSGSGKSTLLRLIAGLERPDAGSILLDGTDITLVPAFERGLGFVQQSYALFPHMTVRDNIAFGIRNRIANPVTVESRVTRLTDSMLELVGLGGLGDRMVGQISGGQKQRVSLARTLITEPRICLLDEPLGALDANLRERMTSELRRIREALGVTFLHVTGNEHEALAMGDRVIILDEGRAIQVDPPDIIFSRPATVAVARYINRYNILPGCAENGGFLHAGTGLPIPGPIPDARFYAVRHDRISVWRRGDSPPGKSVTLEAEFLASEFMGSRVVYFLKRPDGEVFEVDRHLSIDDPTEFNKGERLELYWEPADVLFYDGGGRLLPAETGTGATQ